MTSVEKCDLKYSNLWLNLRSHKLFIILAVCASWCAAVSTPKTPEHFDGSIRQTADVQGRHLPTRSARFASPDVVSDQRSMLSDRAVPVAASLVLNCLTMPILTDHLPLHVHIVSQWPLISQLSSLCIAILYCHQHPWRIYIYHQCIIKPV